LTWTDKSYKRITEGVRLFSTTEKFPVIQYIKFYDIKIRTV